MDNSGAIIGCLVLALALVAYISPVIVAAWRNCKAMGGILVVDLFLGWTFIGWVIALAWAASGEVKPKVAAATIKGADAA
jgi:hypothetical protein